MHARAHIADVHADDAPHEQRVPHRELVAKDAAPVVQHQCDLLARAGLLDDVFERVHQLRQCIAAPRFADVEPRQREADAAVVRAQVRDLRVPQAVGVRPAVHHDDGMIAAAFDENIDAVNLPRVRHCAYYFPVLQETR